MGSVVIGAINITDLCSNISEEVFDVFPNEKIVHDRLPILLQNLLELIDVVVLKVGKNIGVWHSVD